jgi:hypothetical protein
MTDTNSATPDVADPRTTLRVHPERTVPHEAAAILAEGRIAHVAFVVEEQPHVIPMTYQYDAATPHHIYLHGAHHSRLMQHLASGAPVCIEVTLVDGLVYSRTALYHSVNYRSVVAFARAAGDAGGVEQQRTLLQAMIGRFFPGRTAGLDYDVTPDAHLTATAFVALEVEAWSAKARRGGPKGPRDDDPGAPGSAGVVELGTAV